MAHSLFKMECFMSMDNFKKIKSGHIMIKEIMGLDGNAKFLDACALRGMTERDILHAAHRLNAVYSHRVSDQEDEESALKYLKEKNVKLVHIEDDLFKVKFGRDVLLIMPVDEEVLIKAHFKDSCLEDFSFGDTEPHYVEDKELKSKLQEIIADYYTKQIFLK